MNITPEIVGGAVVIIGGSIVAVKKSGIFNGKKNGKCPDEQCHTEHAISVQRLEDLSVKFDKLDSKVDEIGEGVSFIKGFLGKWKI